MKFDYIIFHKNCLDGFTGFYLFMKTKKWIPKPFVYPDVPFTTKIPDNIDGKNIIIIDVAYKPNILRAISKKAKYVLFIDHHITLYHDIKNVKSKNIDIVFDEKESGASLVWNYFFKNKKMPKFVKYIKDNDIGKWKYENTMPFISALELEFKLKPEFKNLKHWDKLLNSKFVKKMVKRGTYYNKYKNYMIERFAKKHIMLGFPSNKAIKKFKLKNISRENYKVAITSSTCPSASLIGKYIVENFDCDFAIIFTYRFDKNRYILSFRSNSVDVGKIAKQFGGGGHKYAAAASFYKDQFEFSDLFVY